MQNLLIPNVRRERAGALADELEAAGLRLDASPFWRGTVACTGSEFCKLALTETKGFARALVEELESRLPGFDEHVKLHVTGCPNSCGQHWIADIGIEGKKVKVDGALVDAYYFCVGGALGRHSATARPIGLRVPAADVGAAIERLLRAFLAERLAGENFREFCARHTDEELRALLAGEQRAELLVGVTRAEFPEVLPGETLGEERAEQPLDRRADVRSGDAEADRPGRGRVAAEGAADAKVVGIHERAVHLDLLALDADVGDPVLAAAVRAPRHVDLHVLVEPRQPRLQLLHEGAREPLRLREGELAEFRARACDRPAPEGRSVEPKPGGLERVREGARAVALDVRDQEVLHVGRPDFAGPVALRQVRSRAHLGGSQPTAQHRDARVDQPLLLLAMEPHVVAVDVLGRVVGHAVLEGPAKPVLDRREELLGGPA